VIGVVLLAAAGAKTLAFGQFEATVWVSGMLPRALVPAGCAVIVVAEFAIGVGLMTRRARAAAARALVVLSCMFITYSLWRSLAAIPEPCSCFGALFRMSPLQAGMVDLVLLVVGLWLDVGAPGRCPLAAKNVVSPVYWGSERPGRN